jgi:hypothetical protein
MIGWEDDGVHRRSHTTGRPATAALKDRTARRS